MTDTALISRAWAVWEGLAMVPARFAVEPAVVVSPGSLWCPPGWAGVIAIGGRVLATAPDAQTARILRGRLEAETARMRSGRLEADPNLSALAGLAAEFLGPASLAYLDAADFRPEPDGLERLPPGHRDLDALVTSVSRADADECGLDEVTSPVFVVREDARIVAASAWCAWPGRVAHLSVLTAADRRGRGLARRVAAAATALALRDGLLPQWRARPEPSRRVARALGFRELGAQLSLRLQP